MKLTDREWVVLRIMAKYFLEGIEGDLEADGCVSCYNTLIKEEVELLKKLANK